MKKHKRRALAERHLDSSAEEFVAPRRAKTHRKPREPKDLPTGTVVGVHATRCVVLVDGVSRRYAYSRIKDPEAVRPVVGDQVTVVGGAEGRVERVLERRTCLRRPDPSQRGRRGADLVVAANVDVAVVVLATRDPEPHPRVIDRYMLAGAQGGVETWVCLNKADLGDPPPKAMEILEAFERSGVPVFRCSSETGEGVAELAEALAGKTVVLVGPSGVGKTSLTHWLCGESGPVAPISSATGKGMHTTRSSSYLPLISGSGALIDTPGVRAFGLVTRDPNELRDWFDEIADLGLACQFRDCMHDREPGCAVLAAVREDPTLAVRYDGYLRLLRELRPIESAGGFSCDNCGEWVAEEGGGTKNRNHCPNCLASKHLDESPGDRAAHCGAIMEPVALWVRRGGEWAVVHRCRSCGTLHSNRVAADDNQALLLSLAVRPLSNPPFPLERLAEGRR